MSWLIVLSDGQTYGELAGCEIRYVNDIAIDDTDDDEAILAKSQLFAEFDESPLSDRDGAHLDMRIYGEAGNLDHEIRFPNRHWIPEDEDE